MQGGLARRLFAHNFLRWNDWAGGQKSLYVTEEYVVPFSGHWAA
jgi:hypothetical protein